MTTKYKYTKGIASVAQALLKAELAEVFGLI